MDARQKLNGDGRTWGMRVEKKASTKQQQCEETEIERLKGR